MGIHHIMQQYGAEQKQLATNETGLLPRTIRVQDEEGKVLTIQYDVQPVPIIVPRTSIAGNYARGGMLR